MSTQGFPRSSETSARAAAYLAKDRILIHSLGEAGRGIGAALPPFLQIRTTDASEQIGPALRSALAVPVITVGHKQELRTVASSRRRHPWRSWARKLVRNCECCIVIRSDMGTAIVPTRKHPSHAEPRAFLDLEGKLIWLGPSASDGEIADALMRSFARCE